MAEISYTQHVEKWLTGSKKALIRDTNQLFREEYLLAENADFQEYAKECLRELKSLRDKHCNGSLAYAMIKLLHSDKKLNVGEDSAGMCIIAGKRVHASNIRCPSAIKEEDYEKYAAILTSIAVEAGRFSIPSEITEELLYNRFLGIFSKNRFLKNTKQQKYVSIEKKHIVELCFSLGWNSEKCDALLLRTDLEPLWANSMDDAVFRFMLDVKEAKWKDKYDIPAAVTRQATNKKKSEIVVNPYTNVVVNSLESIIRDNSISEFKRRKDYVQCLYEHQRVFEHFSNSCRNVFEHLLLYAVHNMGWQLGFKLPKNILQCDIPPLEKMQQERLIKALYTGESQTTADLFLAKEEDLGFKATHKSDLYSFPQYVEDELYRISIHDQLMPLLNSEIRVGKNHILYALYLVFATSESRKKRQARENLIQEYTSFVETATTMLNLLNLPQFYAPCPLEYTIAVSILAGAHQEAFQDVTGTFMLLEKRQDDPGAKAEDEPVKNLEMKKQDDSEAKAVVEPVKKSENMPADFTDGLKKDLELSMKTISEDMLDKLKEAYGSYLYDSLQTIVQKITKSWRSIGLLPANVKFLSDSHLIMFCPDGYMPVCLGQLDTNLTDLLFGEDTSDGELLKAFCVPYKETAITLYDAAATYPCNGEESLLDTFQQNPRLNLRYRQNCILRLLGSLVMSDLDAKGGKRPQIYTNTGEDPCIKFSFINEEDIRIQENQNIVEQIDNGAQEQDAKIVTFSKTCIPVATPKVARDRAPFGSESFDGYKQVVERFPILSAEQEAMLFQRIRQNQDDQEARDEIIYSNLRVLISVARRWKRLLGKAADAAVEDLANEGYFGLVTAIEKYNPEKDSEKKARFSTYAYSVISRSIKDAINNDMLIRIPKEKLLEIFKLKEKEDAFYQEYGREATEDELAQITGKSISEIQRLFNMDIKTYSYDANLTDENSSFLTLMEDPSSDLEHLLLLKAIKKRIYDLPPRAATILQLHYGLTDKGTTYTLPEISKILGISLEEAVRTELESLKKIRRLEM